MGKRDRRVDAYIAQAAPFAQPILKHLRDVVHKNCPKVEETLKWRFPWFLYEGMLCSMAAFKSHCSFGFWKHRLLLPDSDSRTNEGMGQFGRLTSLSDLPNDAVIRDYLKRAMRLNEEGTKPEPRRPVGKRKKMTIPAYLQAGLKQNRVASEAFQKLSPSHQREYVEWLLEAKREETRQKRLATTLSWLSEGKPRNWKYMNC